MILGEMLTKAIGVRNLHRVGLPNKMTQGNWRTTKRECKSCFYRRITLDKGKSLKARCV